MDLHGSFPSTDNTVYVYGQIVSQQGSIEFTAPLNDLRDAPTEWLEQFCTAHALPLPFVHRKYRRGLYDLFLLSSMPVETNHPAFGWAETGGVFCFPCVLATPQTLSYRGARHIAADQDHAPFNQIDAAAPMIRYDSRAATQWAAAFVYNLFAWRSGQPQSIPIHSPNSEKTLLSLANGLSLPIGKTKQGPYVILSSPNGHDNGWALYPDEEHGITFTRVNPDTAEIGRLIVHTTQALLSQGAQTPSVHDCAQAAQLISHRSASASSPSPAAESSSPS